ncbi:superoxide dismutase [Paenibacillaceae bacterium WGS1546]|uniref:superoxide dismutase n=1 Tax=Cohnella sp. WGS1546 TaxID=3366810 RepID=UPI00372D73A1
MLSVYGKIDPPRLLEQLSIWKTREREQAAAIRSAIPDLEPAYAKWLVDWENLFAKTQEFAERFQAESATRSAAEAGGNESFLYPRLLEDAIVQSREFSRQLLLLSQYSPAAARSAGTGSVKTALEEPPRFFDGILERLREAGAVIPASYRNAEESAPEGSGGPEPADGVQSFSPRNEASSAEPGRPEGTWSDPMGVLHSSGGGPVPIGGHKLPPLPYSYKALEPYIDEKTMRIHHDKHHQSYVDGLNKAEKKLEEARKSGDFELVKHWERELAFHGAGHYLHTIFWDAMSPKGGGKPTGALLEEINRSFGNYDAFKKQFSEAANNVEGGGWAILVWSPRSHRLEILTAEKHQNLSQWDVVPLLPLDVWEHAYYLKHQNDRAAYIKDWWHVVNWPYVSERFAKARALKWVPY